MPSRPRGIPDRAIVLIIGLATALPPAFATGQEPRVPPGLPGARDASPPARALPAPAQRLPEVTDEGADLTSRYRFRELYSITEDGPGLSEYQVAFRQTYQNPQAAPGSEAAKASNLLQEGRYTERPAELGPGDDQSVVALVRRFESARDEPDNWSRPGGPKLLEGMTLWYRSGVDEAPQVLVLDGGRRLREREYLFATRFTPYLPSYLGFLPIGPTQLFAPWPLEPAAIGAILGLEGGPASANGTGRLSSVRPSNRPGDPEGSMVARIEVEGSTQVGVAEARFRGELEFTFVPAENAGANPAGSNRPAGAPLAAISETEPGVIEAVGGISQVRFSQVVADREAGRSIRRQLLIQRRWPADGPALELPATPPSATPENAWLVFADREGRFHVAHPPAYVALLGSNPADPSQAANDKLILRAERPSGIDQIMLTYIPKSATPADPGTLLAQSLETFREYYRASSTPVATLPENSWPGVEARRVEAALTPLAADQLATPVHYDGYVLQFPDGSAVVVDALTPDRDGAAAFRDQAESILKTYAPGPPVD